MRFDGGGSVSLARLQPWVESRQAFRQLSRGATLRTCAPVALVVGSLLSAVNEGDVLASGMVNRRVVVKLAANLLIPFLTFDVQYRGAVGRPDQA